MSEQHTPIPWSFSRDDENGVEFNITSDKWYVAVCCDAPGNGFPQANARRIVAAVNACAGYTIEELEQAALDKRHRHEIIADLVKSNKQRDELLADAVRMNWIEKTFFQHHWNGVVGSGNKTHWRVAGDYRQTAAKMDGSTFREAIDTAIASVKGGA